MQAGSVIRRIQSVNQDMSINHEMFDGKHYWLVDKEEEKGVVEEVAALQSHFFIPSRHPRELRLKVK